MARKNTFQASSHDLSTHFSTRAHRHQSTGYIVLEKRKKKKRRRDEICTRFEREDSANHGEAINPKFLSLCSAQLDVHVEEGAAVKTKEGVHDGSAVGAATVAPFH